MRISIWFPKPQWEKQKHIGRRKNPLCHARFYRMNKHHYGLLCVRVTFVPNDKYSNVSSLFTRFVCECYKVIYTIEKSLRIAYSKLNLLLLLQRLCASNLMEKRTRILKRIRCYCVTLSPNGISNPFRMFSDHELWMLRWLLLKLHMLTVVAISQCIQYVQYILQYIFHVCIIGNLQRPVSFSIG